MMDDTDRRLALARAPGLNLDQLRAAGAAEQPGQLVGLAAADLQAGTLRSDRRWLESQCIHLIGCEQTAYPPLLRQIDAAPAALYVRGDPDALVTAQLAIVGSRNPTPGGARTARDFSAFLAQHGLTITSGLALGIDAAAHEGALSARGRTIAVLGSGLDRLYPPENAALAERIAGEGGAVLSEFPPGTPPQREHFPRRNRLISGLSLGTLVVEAARHSGSLITARLAGTQGREVFAIPGSIHNPLARGCHELLRQGAKLVESAADILSELKISEHNQLLIPLDAGAQMAPDRVPELDKDYEILLDALGFEPQSIDALVDRTGLPSPHLASMLLILELEGRVGSHAGGRYARVK
jgi:DNA processing protein